MAPAGRKPRKGRRELSKAYGTRAISPNAVRENVVTMEDIAGAVFFLFDNRGVNGIDLKVDGGGLLV